MPTQTTKKSGGTIRVGISGWTYEPWRKVFYPKDLVQKNELAFASAMLPTIEINGTFYGLQRPESFAAWHKQTPDGFVFSVKANRFITHIRRLKDVQTNVANFLLSGVLRLNEKLGPILWQCPPNLKFDADIVETFLSQLPQTTAAAVELRKHTDAKINGRLWVKIDEDRPLRHAMEIRHRSFADFRFVQLLRKYNVALVTADTAGEWPMLHDVTADFVYVRLHGESELYASGYTESALNEWAGKIRAWSEGNDVPTGKRAGPPVKTGMNRDVYVYFDNSVKVNSPFDASRLLVKLGIVKEAIKPKSKLIDKQIPRPSWPGFGKTSK